MLDRVWNAAFQRGGYLVATVAVLLGMVGVVTGIVGTVTENDDMASDGWRIAGAVSIAGGLLRLGYKIGEARAKKSVERLERIELRIERMHAELIDGSVVPLRLRVQHGKGRIGGTSP